MFDVIDVEVLDDLFYFLVKNLFFFLGFFLVLIELGNCFVCCFLFFVFCENVLFFGIGFVVDGCGGFGDDFFVCGGSGGFKCEGLLDGFFWGFESFDIGELC